MKSAHHFLAPNMVFAYRDQKFGPFDIGDDVHFNLYCNTIYYGVPASNPILGNFHVVKFLYNTLRRNIYDQNTNLDMNLS